MTAVRPTVHERDEAGARLPLLVWRLPGPVLAISSAPFGGGIGARRWVLNATVPSAYSRLDPAGHLAELARDLDLDGAGVGLLTAVDVRTAVTATDGGVTVTATVGLGHPTWAAAADGHLRRERPGAGTINVVAWLPVQMSASALVNAVATVTEAKAQALWECQIAATGTATDALCLACPLPPGHSGDAAEPIAAASEEAYGGPRSQWGARLARAVHAAVHAGTRAWAEPSEHVKRGAGGRV